MDPSGPASSRPTEASPQEHSLENVLGAGSDVLRRSIGGLSSEELDFEHLEGVFDSARQAMVDGVEDADIEAGGSAATSSYGDDGLSVQQLYDAVDTIDTGGRNLTLRTTDSAYEEATILMQLLSTADADDTRNDVLERFAAALPRVPIEGQYELYRKALGDLAASLALPYFDRLYPLLADTLRREPAPFLHHLSSTITSASPYACEALWPHVANELLLTLRGRAMRPDDPLAVLIDSARTEALPRVAARLSHLSAASEKCIVPGTFDMSQRFAYLPLVALLGTHRADSVGPAVFSAVQAAPPTLEVLEPTIRSLDTYRSEYNEFLAQVLLSARAGANSHEAIDAAARLLVQTIGRLEAERREEPWLPEILTWLGERCQPHARELFERIATQRSGLLKTWPRACRRAAEQGFKHMKSRGAY